MAAIDTRLERLVALCSTQEAAMSEPMPVRDFASISREYRATLAEIDGLEPKGMAGDGIDEIAARRAARRASATQAPVRTKRTK